MDVSIIIVNYNTKKLTEDAIKSVFNSRTGFSYEIILIDNHSSDGSVNYLKQQFPEIKIIENYKNLGFSKANNQGIKIAKGRYILLLNSDTIINVETLETMIDFMDRNKRIGASGCKVILPNGKLDEACRRGFPTPSASLFYLLGLAKIFPESPTFNRYHLGHLDIDEDYPVDSLVGAFMIVRKETINEIGLLDEEFFMYGEDIDWCYRIKEAGWIVYYYPYTQIIHYKGASSRKKPFKIVYEFHRAMFLFHKKHYEKKYAFIVNWFVYAGISIKLASATIKNLMKRR